MSGYRAAWGGNVSPSYPACLYPGQTSLEELSSMTAACLSSQGNMTTGLYPRPNWYTMPGHHSPSNIGPAATDQPFSQAREYFEPLGKAPSPIPAGCGGGGDQVTAGYRSPSYRTNYYPQDCEKY